MTVEGVPNYGIMPIGAREDIYDMENMESVSLYKGASPADLGTGSGKGFVLICRNIFRNLFPYFYGNKRFSGV